ncbi:MAG: hypothetical protein GY856_18495 [bacterium]|nr:hypothetical protein [bacterium]
MLLPGGLWHDGERRRSFAFKPLTGAVELAIAESGEGDRDLPLRVSLVLAAALAELGGQRPTPQLAGQLPVADRQFLVRLLAAHLGRGGVWLTVPCHHCAEPFDFFVEQSALPVKEAGEGFPFAGAEISAGRCHLRIPTGADQQAVAGLEDDADAVETLARRCLTAIDDDGDHGSGASLGDLTLSRGDLAAINAALEAVAPEVALQVQPVCPECGQANEVAVDPYLCLSDGGDELFAEIFHMATTYHWSEPEILALPRHRRQRYLKLADQARGMFQ